MHLRVDKAASLCIRPQVPAADGPVYALWPSGYESAAHEGLLMLLLMHVVKMVHAGGQGVEIEPLIWKIKGNCERVWAQVGFVPNWSVLHPSCST